MSVGMVMTLVVREPDSEVPEPAGLWRTIVDPFSDYLQRAYDTVLWPLAGFIFLPLTTLAYAWAFTFEGGAGSGAGVIVIVIAVLFDIGSWGGGAGSGAGKKAA